MRPRGLIAISLLTAMSPRIALFALGHITTVAELLALTMLGVFWVLVPVLFLCAITWTYVRDLLRSRGIMREELSHEQAGHAGR